MLHIDTAFPCWSVVAIVLAASACDGDSLGDVAASTIAIEVTPASAAVQVSGEQVLVASVTGTINTDVMWTVEEGPSGGSVNAGTYTAPGIPGVFHVVVTSVADSTKSATATVTVTLNPPGGAKLGTNLNWCVDWDPEKLPADLVWSARPWALGSGNGDAPSNWAPIDARGWPIVTPGTTFGAIFEGSPWPGTYKLSFRNRQGTSGDTVTSYSGNIQLTNRRHNLSTNVTTYDVVVPSYVFGQFIWLRWAGSTGGITDVHLMRPLKDGSGWHAIGTPLSNHIIDRLQWFKAIRVAQTQSGTSGKVSGRDSTWSDRTSPWGPQTRSRGSPGHFGGVAWENLIAMANQAQKDLWLEVPFDADDDYILKMARTLRYGSDGTNPYTSEQANPVFAPLAPNLAVYIEHGNEIWNSSAGYWEAENEAAAAAAVAAGDPYYLGAVVGTQRANDSGVPGWGWRRTGYLAVRHSLLFRQVFGNAAMMTRVRPVLATQHARYGTTLHPLRYIESVWGTASPYTAVGGYTNPKQPVSYYLYALATAPYVPDDNAFVNVSSPEAMCSSTVARLASGGGAGSISQAMIDNRAQAASYRIKYLAYEGGDNLIPQLMSGGASAGNISNATLASYDASRGVRMGANISGGLPASDQTGYVYGKLFQNWENAGGDLFMHYTLGQVASGGSMFGLCAPTTHVPGADLARGQSGSDCRYEFGPKWDAVKAFSRAWQP